MSAAAAAATTATTLAPTTATLASSRDVPSVHVRVGGGQYLQRK